MIFFYHCERPQYLFFWWTSIPKSILNLKSSTQWSVLNRKNWKKKQSAPQKQKNKNKNFICWASKLCFIFKPSSNHLYTPRENWRMSPKKGSFQKDSFFNHQFSEDIRESSGEANLHLLGAFAVSSRTRNSDVFAKLQCLEFPENPYNSNGMNGIFTYQLYTESIVGKYRIGPWICHGFWGISFLGLPSLKKEP